jgi:hypothetical protein
LRSIGSDTAGTTGGDSTTAVSGAAGSAGDGEIAGSGAGGLFLKKLNMVLSVTGAAVHGEPGLSRYNFSLVAL